MADFSKDNHVFYGPELGGKEAIFRTPNSTSEDIHTKTLIDSGMADGFNGFESQVEEETYTLTLPFSDVGTPVVGDEIIVESDIYTVSTVTSNDQLDVMVMATLAKGAWEGMT